MSFGGSQWGCSAQRLFAWDTNQPSKQQRTCMDSCSKPISGGPDVYDKRLLQRSIGIQNAFRLVGYPALVHTRMTFLYGGRSIRRSQEHLRPSTCRWSLQAWALPVAWPQPTPTAQLRSALRCDVPAPRRPTMLTKSIASACLDGLMTSA